MPAALTAFDRYFEKKNIVTRYNTLGMTTEMIESFLGSTMDLVEPSQEKFSQFVKHDCYSRFVDDLAVREKYTGFEAFEELDAKIRTKLNNTIIEEIDAGFAYQPTSVRKSKPSIYKKLLVAAVNDIDLPKLVYTSGGIDTELLVNTLVTSGVEFTPVIFTWTDAQGNVKNSADVAGALEICKKYNLTPVTKTVDVETLWSTLEFFDLATSIKLTSPQKTTHAYMVELMSKEFPAHAHLFAGEVRYSFSRVEETNEDLCVVFSTKAAVDFDVSVYPSGYFRQTNIYITTKGPTTGSYTYNLNKQSGDAVIDSNKTSIGHGYSGTLQYGAGTGSALIAFTGPHSASTLSITMSKTGHPSTTKTVSLSANNTYSPYTYERGFVQEFYGGSTANLSLAKQIGSKCYMSSDYLGKSSDGTDCYGLYRYPDAPGIFYWTSTNLQMWGGNASHPTFLQAFSDAALVKERERVTTPNKTSMPDPRVPNSYPAINDTYYNPNFYGDFCGRPAR